MQMVEMPVVELLPLVGCVTGAAPMLPSSHIMISGIEMINGIGCKVQKGLRHLTRHVRQNR
jgi:hypothetical protein